ncbi:C39 family peptidase [Massiliimalia massiliensis]|uniref:C39 family peptidase n=1 Tax=Massiliimalia massiliensis TaxID=1852384 RepID=UPI0009877551|nr:C39 family peptidase [Massiliimalia massiliensis]
MQSVHTKYHLDGTIDTSSWYVGNKGQDIDGLEIRVYDEDSVIDGDFTGREASLNLSYMVNNLNNWESFPNATLAPQIDGIKIQTSTSKNYYLEYKTKNEGMSDYLPLVKSTGRASNDYAGLPGKPIQLLHIQAYDKDGTRLRSGVIVMYRVHVEERWLPWVSNADSEWMRQAKTKYGLDGLLDTESTYAGNDVQNINGVEIIEENDTNGTTHTLTGDYKIINVSFISQYPKYPTGCESVSTVMVLRHIGNQMTVDTFIDKYLNKGSTKGFNPYVEFLEGIHDLPEDGDVLQKQSSLL